MTTQVLDQYSISATMPSSGGLTVNGNQAIAQIFQAGLSGTLEAVAVAVTCTRGAKTLRPHVSIYSVVDGALSQVLGEVAVGTRNIALPSRVAFTSGIPQAAGERYAIVVTYPDAQVSDQFRWSGAMTSDSAKICLIGTLSGGGWNWSAQTGLCDFQTYVLDGSSTDTDTALGPIAPRPQVRGDGIIPGQG